MAAFYDVSNGATVAAADPNQYANIFNGTTNGYVVLVQAAGANVPVTGQLASAPGSDNDVVAANVTSDTANRIAFYIRGPDGYGGLRGGAGGSITAHLYVQSTGWKITESLTVATNLTVSGSTTLGAITATSITTSGGGTIGGALGVNQLIANYANGSYYDGSSAFSGSGTGSYTHGLNHTPTFVGVIAQPGAGSTTTFGTDAVGTTTVHVDINGAFAFQAWAVLN